MPQQDMELLGDLHPRKVVLNVPHEYSRGVAKVCRLSHLYLRSLARFWQELSPEHQDEPERRVVPLREDAKENAALGVTSLRDGVAVPYKKDPTTVGLRTHEHIAAQPPSLTVGAGLSGCSPSTGNDQLSRKPQGTRRTFHCRVQGNGRDLQMIYAE